MKHPLIVQMHPDGVFVFLSLLIYGGLFSTQKKNLHFNFHYLNLSPQCSSPGKELMALLLSSSPTLYQHWGGYGSRGGMGSALQEQAHADEISSEMQVCLCPLRTLDMSSPVYHPFPPCCDGGGRQQPCVVSNTSPCLFSCSLRNSSQEKSEKDLDMLRLVPAGDS